MSALKSTILVHVNNLLYTQDGVVNIWPIHWRHCIPCIHYCTSVR